MNTGTYDRAWLTYRTAEKDFARCVIYKASLISHPSGIIEVVHYLDGAKLAENKRTIYLPLRNLIDFEGIGYAN